jgi:uncharacterized protein DUF4912/tetratricopeptide repeat protein
MAATRTELESLDRDALITRAEAAGVKRARILTRPELVDELLLRAAQAGDRETARVRGFFGRARDLLARVIELGLNLPDAAERVRGNAPPPPRRSVAPALPTVTLAEIYAAQGHRERAVETLKNVLEQEPEHAAARTLLAQLEDESYSAPSPPLPPEPDEEAPPAALRSEASSPTRAEPARATAPAPEPFGMLDDAPLPARYDVDECVAIPVDPRTLFIYWEVREATLGHLRRQRPEGVLALRVLVITPTWEGPIVSARDHDVDAAVGDWFERELPAGCVVRAAIGWRVGGEWTPIAHSPALETPPDSPSPLLADVLVRWTPAGAFPVSRDDADAASIERALGRARSRVRPLGEGHPAADSGTKFVSPGASEAWTSHEVGGAG